MVILYLSVSVLRAGWFLLSNSVVGRTASLYCGAGAGVIVLHLVAQQYGAVCDVLWLWHILS